MRKAALLLAAAVAIMACPAGAETGLPDPGAVAAALDAHPAVMAADARTAASAAEAEALARGPHEFTLSTGYLQRTVDREGRYNEYDATLSRSIRLPGKASLDRQIGSAGLLAAQNQAEDFRHQTANLLADQWWDWLAAAAEAQIDRQAVTNFSQMLATTQRRVELRDAARLEVDLAQASLGAARLAAEQSAGRAEVARVRLVAQFPTLALPASAPEIPLPATDTFDIAELGAKIVERSHEIAAADAESLKSGKLAERIRRDRIPDPSLGLRVFSERDNAERGVGLVFSLPLGGGYRRALADKASAEAGAARAEAEAARFGVNQMATADMAEARFRHTAWQRAREAVTAQVAALMKLRIGHAAGEIDLADVLLAERQVHDAFRAEMSARAEAQRSLTRLRIDSHELWISD